MKIEKFEIENFKGIKSTTIDVNAVDHGCVVTLIGLNESGKTTVLEAISNFVTEDAETSSLVQTVQKRQAPDELVPKSQKGIFTGKISIRATVLLDENDINAASSELLQKHQIKLDVAKLSKRILVERRFTFEDGDLKDNKAYWTITAFGYKGRSTKPVPISSNGDQREVWLSLVESLRPRIPKIVYFPTFLFAFPERIYLRDLPEWKPTDEAAIINRYYRQVLQDVADSIRNPADPKQRVSIEKQVVQRLQDVKEPTGNPFAFWSYFSAQKEYDKVRAVLNSVAERMGSVVFEAWNKIFDKPTTGKKVQIDFGVDPNKDNTPWVKLSIFDGKSTYDLHERSLGFRWFFSFLLFTQFRKSRLSGSTSVFLFDEPASNLHSAAQMRLMESFSTLTKDGSVVVYSTHSHYLVNPLWLERAYIIKNAAIDYETDLDINADAAAVTDIEAHRYRKFVSENPSRVSYYQPALDALKFQLGPMIPRSDAIIVEGKFDFHPLEYFKRRFKNSDFDVFPINGAGDAAALISLFRGWGINYAILLDDDKGGKEALKKYKSEMNVPSARLITLRDVDASLSGKAFEGLYGSEIDALAKPYAAGGKVTKRTYHELFADRVTRNLLTEPLGPTEVLGKKIVDTVAERLSKLS